MRFGLKRINTYHPVLSLLLIFAIFGQTFHNELLLMDYLINTSAYAAHCVNKEKTEVHCNGMCQLGKKMDDDQNTESPQNIVKIEQVVLFYDFSEQSEKTPVFKTENKPLFPAYNFSSGTNIQNSILRPPIV